MPVTPHAQRLITASSTTPSYARPTAASENRKAGMASVDAKGQVQQRKTRAAHKASPSRMPPRRYRELRTAKLAGFFDLPGELRNSVYELCQLDRESRRLNFHSGLYRDHPTKAIPALLRVDDRLLDEAGSYYFDAGNFDILLDGDHSKPLSRWFAAIGAANQARLVGNECVTLRFVHDGTICKREPCHRSWDRLEAWRISSDYVCHVLDLAREIPRADAASFGMGHWRAASECQMTARTWITPRSKQHQPTVYACELHPSKLFRKQTQEEMRWVTEKAHATLAALERVRKRSRS